MEENIYMEERKRLAKEIDKKFAMKQALISGGHFALFAIFVIAGLFQAIIVADIAIILFLLSWPFTINLSNLYSYSGKLMICRALVGQQISADPVAEGVQRYKSFGGRQFRMRGRTCGTILYMAASGAMAAASVLDYIPVIKNFTFVYKSIVDRAYKNTAEVILSYQVGCYENADEDQFFDLLTYFLQNGKNYLVRTVKTEVKTYILCAVSLFLMGLSAILCFFTQSLAFGFVFVAAYVLYFIFGIKISRDGDFKTFCEYIEYVQSNPLNTQLRDKIYATCKKGDKVLNIKDVITNPNAYTLKKAVNSFDELTKG